MPALVEVARQVRRDEFAVASADLELQLEIRVPIDLGQHVVVVQVLVFVLEVAGVQHLLRVGLVRRDHEKLLAWSAV
jgi:hypothetical protein